MEQRELINAKEKFLGRYLEAVKKRDTAADEVQKLRMNEMFPSVGYSDMPRAGSTRDLSDYMVHYEEKMDALEEAETNVISEKEKVLAVIDKLNDKDEQFVLRRRYIDGIRSLRHIAKERNVSKSWLYNVYSSAISNIEEDTE